MAKARYKDVIIADSDITQSVEGNHYFPRESVRMEFLKASATQYTCSWKGEAEYFHAEVNGEMIRDIAWSYPDPKQAAKNIAGYLAFDKRKGVEIL